MRASVRKDDTAYSPENRKLEVYLDGVKLRRCITADEEKGEVLIYSEDENGHYIREGDEVKTEIRTGKVEIRRKV